MEKKFNFDITKDRRNTNSMKWNVAENELPMWVADMDFETAPAITDALRKRVEHGIFGYSEIPPAWNMAYAKWWKTRHEFDLIPDDLIFVSGVIPAISSIIRKLTTPAEKVVIMTPVYNIFFNSIYNNGREILEAPISYANGDYQIDFQLLERTLSDPQVALLILCNPQNPIGRVWDKETLRTIGELALKQNVLIVSDEIHCDLTAPNVAYVPFASVSEECAKNSISCFAPTKTFNIAGIQTAAVYVEDKTLRHKVWRALNTDEIAEPNVFAVDAAIAAYEGGAKWLDELRIYIEENRQLVTEYIENEIVNLHLINGNATYLLWLDCMNVLQGGGVENGAGGNTGEGGNGNTSSDFAKYLRRTTGLFLSDGAIYGGNGNRFLRMNIATSRENVKDGLNRLKSGVNSYLEAAPQTREEP